MTPNPARPSGLWHPHALSGRGGLVLTCLALMSLAFAGTAAAGTVQVTYIGGEPVTGKIASIELVGGTPVLALRDLATPAMPTRLDLREVEEVRWPNAEPEDIPAARFLRLTLASGDVLVGTVKSQTDDGCVFTSMSFGDVTIELDWIAELYNRKSKGPLERDQNAEKKEQDALYFADGDVASGDFDAIGPKGVEFSNALLDGELEWEGIIAVTRYLASAAKPRTDQLQVIATCRNGERFFGRLTKYENRTFTLVSTVGLFGGRLTVTVPEDRLASLTFQFGKFAYLSDLTPKVVKEYPFFGGERAAPAKPEDNWFHYRNDQSVSGKPLMLDNAKLRRVTYAKGLGVHSYCKLTYALNGKYARFMADIGIDAAAGQLGSVVFRVFLDDATKPAYDSGIVRRSAPLQSISVDVRGKRLLHLEVDFADNGDVQDHANWAKARVIKD